MHAKVQDGIGLEIMLQPLVECGILGVGGQVALKEEAHGIPLHPQGRLDSHPDIPQLDAAHQQISCVMESDFRPLLMDRN